MQTAFKCGHEFVEKNIYRQHGYSECRTCCIARVKKSTDSEKAKIRSAQWRKNNPERFKEAHDRHYAENKDRVCAEQRAKRKENPLRFKAYDLKKRFGLTLERFNEMLASQQSKCAGCGTDAEDTKWCVDHDHKCCPGRKSCGKCLRGILCSNCNRALGLAKDSAEALRSLADYLESR
jgi:hypothetical protein